MTDHASVSVAEKLERSRRDVLDLTLRNSLLNFRVLKAKGVKVIDEIPARDLPDPCSTKEGYVFRGCR